MAFKDKNQDVIDLKLTQFGKGSLIRGVFQPVYYRFFDDSIIYDTKYAGYSENQNTSEDRIKLDLTLDTQHLVTGVQTRFEDETKKIKQGLRPVFLELQRNENPIEKEKHLQCALYRCDVGSQKQPYYTIQSHTSQFTNTGPIQYLTQSGIQSKIPQLNINATYEITTDRQNEISNPGVLYDSETYIDLSKPKVTFLDNSSIEVDPEMISLSVDEFNVPFTDDNFELELYEVVEDKTVTETNEVSKEIRLVRLEDPEDIFQLFEIKTDADARSVPLDKRKTENFFTN